MDNITFEFFYESAIFPLLVYGNVIYLLHADGYLLACFGLNILCLT